jgi:cell division protein FtsI (penicillin-binding protein 3)
MVRPLFVKEIRRGAEVIKTFKPYFLRDKVCSERTLNIMKSCLEGVMKEGGTGAKLTSTQFTIAGKTGTARILHAGKGYGTEGEEKYQASFVGYFPAEDPIYSCIVVVTDPSKDYYGAVVSGTVFTAVANKVYATTLKYHEAVNEGRKVKKIAPVSISGNRYDLIRSFKLLGVDYTIKEDGEWMLTQKDSSRVLLQKRTVSKNTVPNVIGLSARDAVYLIESKGMSAHIRGYGKVTKQSIPPGRPIFKGGVIELIMD